MTQDSPRHRTIKALVFDYVHRCGGQVDYDDLTALVQAQFPESKWKETHWAWYRTQITRGRFRDQFSESERIALRGGKPLPEASTAAAAKPARAPGHRGRSARDPEVKRLGDVVLEGTRAAIAAAAGEDVDLRFKINRWVFARLNQDEIQTKRPIKKHLWESGMRACQACSQPFETLKGVELHRKQGALAYSVENCELLCRDCHQELD